MSSSEGSTATRAACQYHHEHTTAVEPTRREYLSESTIQETPTVSSSLVPYGALFGTLLFAVGALANGTQVVNGMFEGAMTGACAGAMVDSFLSRHPPVNPVRRVITRTARRSHGCRHREPRQAETNPQQQRRQQQQQQRCVRQPRPQRRIVQRDVPRSSVRLVRSNGESLLAAWFRWFTLGPGEFSSLSYQQVLSRLRNTVGASDATIAVLPSTTIQNVEKELPAHLRECAVCLEEFESGDERKTLPCFHGFHEACINKWLHQNGSCPSCKHKVGYGR